MMNLNIGYDHCLSLDVSREVNATFQNCPSTLHDNGFAAVVCVCLIK